jgi:anaerobic ribonucleoside-triphosphate reductase activating protein
MNTQLRIAGIVKESIVDGPGIRLVVFTQGCPHNCPGCHNPETHPYEGGKKAVVMEILDMVRRNPLLDGITFSGGEPFEQAEACSELAHQAHRLGLNIITYTGYTYEYLTGNPHKREGWSQLLDYTDLLVDGRYEQEKKSLLLKFRGSSNQRIIDMKKTRAANTIILADV